MRMDPLAPQLAWIAQEAKALEPHVVRVGTRAKDGKTVVFVEMAGAQSGAGPTLYAALKPKCLARGVTLDLVVVNSATP